MRLLDILLSIGRAVMTLILVASMVWNIAAMILPHEVHPKLWDFFAHVALMWCCIGPLAQMWKDE